MVRGRRVWIVCFLSQGHCSRSSSIILTRRWKAVMLSLIYCCFLFSWDAAHPGSRANICPLDGMPPAFPRPPLPYLYREYGDQQEEAQQDQIDEEHQAHRDEIFHEGLCPSLPVEAPHRLIEVDEHPQENGKVRQIQDNMQPLGGGGFSDGEEHHRQEELDEGGAVDVDGEDAVVDVKILFVPEV